MRSNLSLAAACLACACSAPSAEFPPADSLHQVLANAMELGPGTVVSLDTVIRGDWRTMYVFSPYTPSDRIRACVGERVPTRGIEVDDRISLLVLVPTTGSAVSVAIPRGADFTGEATTRGYPRGAASFVVRKSGPGWSGGLVPARDAPELCGLKG